MCTPGSASISSGRIVASCASANRRTLAMANSVSARVCGSSAATRLRADPRRRPRRPPVPTRRTCGNTRGPQRPPVLATSWRISLPASRPAPCHAPIPRRRLDPADCRFRSVSHRLPAPRSILRARSYQSMHTNAIRQMAFCCIRNQDVPSSPRTALRMCRNAFCQGTLNEADRDRATRRRRGNQPAVRPGAAGRASRFRRARAGRTASGPADAGLRSRSTPTSSTTSSAAPTGSGTSATSG